MIRYSHQSSYRHPTCLIYGTHPTYEMSMLRPDYMSKCHVVVWLSAWALVYFNMMRQTWTDTRWSVLKLLSEGQSFLGVPLNYLSYSVAFHCHTLFLLLPCAYNSLTWKIFIPVNGGHIYLVLISSRWYSFFAICSFNRYCNLWHTPEESYHIHNKKKKSGEGTLMLFLILPLPRSVQYVDLFIEIRLGESKKGFCVLHHSDQSWKIKVKERNSIWIKTV